jgi:hypothetical protein
MAALSQRAKRIIAAGEVLYGGRWQSSLGRAAGVPQSLLAMIASGEREPTDNVYERVSSALISEAVRLRKVSNKIDEMAANMRAELKG